MSYERFALDFERKELLLDLFQEFEKTEREQLEESEKSYQEEFKGVVQIMSLEEDKIIVRDLEIKSQIMPVKMCEEILCWLQPGDQLGLSIGKLDGLWHVIYVSMIGTYDPTEPSSLMLSIPIDYSDYENHLH